MTLVTARTGEWHTAGGGLDISHCLIRRRARGRPAGRRAEGARAGSPACGCGLASLPFPFFVARPTRDCARLPGQGIGRMDESPWRRARSFKWMTRPTPVRPARQFHSWCAAWFDEAGLVGVDDGMGDGRAARVCPGRDVFQGGLADVHRCGDLGTGLAGGFQGEYFEFTGAGSLGRICPHPRPHSPHLEAETSPGSWTSGATSRCTARLFRT